MNIFTTRLDSADRQRAAMQADINSLKTQQILNLTTDAATLPASLTASVTIQFHFRA